MNIGLYESASALSALEHWQDAVAQNISSSQVTGYKKRTVEFAATLMGEMSPNGKTRVGDGQPGSFPQAIYGISYKQGEVSPTKRPLDLALQGQGFFVIQSPDGSKVYTRDGALSIRSDRTLIGASGGVLLSDANSPIQTLPNGNPIVINHDGTIFQGDARLGKVKVVKFDDNSRLIPAGSGGFLAPGQDPVTVDKPEVMQGYLEGANVSPLREMVDLVTISRAYEANQKLIQSRDGTFEKALEKLG